MVVPAQTDAHSFDKKSRDRAVARLPEINGYAERFSVYAGDTAFIRVARKPSDALTQPAYVRKLKIRNASSNEVTLEITPKTNIQIFSQEPHSFKDEGANYRTRIPIETERLPPGLYECAIGDSSGQTSREIYFNVKPRSFQHLDLICVLPTFTWQAYNAVGGGSFYSKPLERTLTVSLDRPLERRRDNSTQAAIPFLTTFREDAVRYTCVDSLDLHRGLDFGDQPPVMALLTHDEYWTAEMRATIDRFLDQGGTLLILAGNVCWWRIELDGSCISVNKEKQQGLWHRQENAEETSFVSSFRFGGYPVDIAIKDAIQKTDTLSAEEAMAMRAIEVVEPSHAIFQNIRLDKNKLFGSHIPIMYREVDGVPLDKNGVLSRVQYQATAISPRILATGYCGRKRFRKAGVVVEADVRFGHVLHLGSFGWSKGLAEKDQSVRQIVINAYRYCREFSR